MRYWEVRLAAEPLFELASTVGVEAAAKELSVAEEKLVTEMAVLRYRYDTETFASDQLYITDKLGTLMPLRYNKGQQIIAAAIEKQRMAGKPVRICLLKARQFGGSTEFEGEIFKDSILRHHRRSMIIAHDLDSARHLRDMSQRYYDNYRLAKPERNSVSDKWWKFKHTEGEIVADSHLLIDTADELSTGHSLTTHNLHLSEVQLWRNATELVKGLFPTVPKHPDTMIFMEGTGCGIGNYWYEFCEQAQDPSSGWEFVFVPWYDVEDYTAPAITPEEEAEIMSSLDMFEVDLVAKGVSPAQLAWRRSTIRDYFKGVVEEFQTQYPATPDEAFSTSGRPVFAVKQVKEGRRKAVDAPKVGNLTWTGDKTAVRFDEDHRGLWSIWEEPSEKDKGREFLYCLGADVAEGIEVIPELGNRGGDYSVAKIFKRDSKTFVGLFRGRIDPDLYAEELRKASRFWPRLPMMIENNPGGSGNVVIRDLKDLEDVYLMMTPELKKPFDEDKLAIGWRTLKDSKREMIDELIEWIREQMFYDPSKTFWNEASTYVRDEKGLTNAQSRKYDDEVIATALALQAHKFLPATYNITVDAPAKTVDPGDDVPENQLRWQRARGQGAVSQHAAVQDTYANFG